MQFLLFHACCPFKQFLPCRTFLSLLGVMCAVSRIFVPFRHIMQLSRSQLLFGRAGAFFAVSHVFVPIKHAVHFLTVPRPLFNKMSCPRALRPWCQLYLLCPLCRLCPKYVLCLLGPCVRCNCCIHGVHCGRCVNESSVDCVRHFCYVRCVGCIRCVNWVRCACCVLCPSCSLG